MGEIADWTRDREDERRMEADLHEDCEGCPSCVAKAEAADRTSEGQDVKP